MFPIKAVQIKGNLKNDRLSYRLCPNTEFSTGRWNTAVTSICCDCKEDINFFCTISSNFSVNTKYNELNDIVTYQQPLFTSLMKAEKNGKIILTANPTWFEINRFSDVLFLNLENSLTGVKIQSNVDAIITIMFKRIA